MSTLSYVLGSLALCVAVLIGWGIAGLIGTACVAAWQLLRERVEGRP